MSSQKTESVSKSKLWFWLRMAWLVAYALMLVSMLNNLARLNTDAISYMRVAEYWSIGNLGFAVNGYLTSAAATANCCGNLGGTAWESIRD